MSATQREKVATEAGAKWRRLKQLENEVAVSKALAEEFKQRKNVAEKARSDCLEKVAMLEKAVVFLNAKGEDGERDAVDMNATSTTPPDVPFDGESLESRVESLEDRVNALEGTNQSPDVETNLPAKEEAEEAEQRALEESLQKETDEKAAAAQQAQIESEEKEKAAEQKQALDEVAEKMAEDAHAQNSTAAREA